jgi:hypothetical protein
MALALQVVRSHWVEQAVLGLHSDSQNNAILNLHPPAPGAKAKTRALDSVEVRSGSSIYGPTVTVPKMDQTFVRILIVSHGLRNAK